MKKLVFKAKQQLNSCMMHDGPESASLASMSPAGLSPEHQSKSHTHKFPVTSTYDSLERPYKPDKLRGYWSMSSFDFYAACSCYAFSTSVFSEIPVYGFLYGGVYFFPAYVLAFLLFAIPVFIIQTFLGQFSSSGIISSLRVMPIFKGLGYSILILNLSTLAYYAVLAAVPFIYAVSSLHVVIPWMSCANKWNTPNCSTHSEYDADALDLDPHATVEFFRYILQINSNDDTAIAFSWPILFATLATWLLTLGVLLQRLSFIGKLFRCAFVLMACFLLAIFVHLVLQANVTWDEFLQYFEPVLPGKSYLLFNSARVAFLSAGCWMVGPGWGNILTLASHNKFRCDSEKLTYRVCFTHLVFMMMALICGRVALDHFEDHVGLFHYHYDLDEHFMQFIYISFAYYFGSFSSLANFWSFLFFTMLFIAELSAVIILTKSVLTAIFDEFERLRNKKTTITIGLVFLMMLTSTFFCSNLGFVHLHILSNVALLVHIIISLLLLLITTWVYGRARFQCDLQFMLGKTISNLKIFLLRFISPVILVLSMMAVVFQIENSDSGTSVISIIIQCGLYLAPPAYMIYKVCQTTGSWRGRLRQCFKPHDWHPVDALNRSFYDVLMGNSEMLVIDNE